MVKFPGLFLGLYFFASFDLTTKTLISSLILYIFRKTFHVNCYQLLQFLTIHHLFGKYHFSRQESYFQQPLIQSISSSYLLIVLGNSNEIHLIQPFGFRLLRSLKIFAAFEEYFVFGLNLFVSKSISHLSVPA